MASFFVRRKRLLVRLLIGCTLLWLLFATFRLSKRQDESKSQYDFDYRGALDDRGGQHVEEHPRPRFVAAPGDGPTAAKPVPPLQPVMPPAHRMPEQPAPNAHAEGPAGNNWLNIPPPDVRTQTTVDPNSPGICCFMQLLQQPLVASRRRHHVRKNAKMKLQLTITAGIL